MLRRRVAHLRNRWALINGLRVFWVVVILWCESGAFLWSLLGCRWPDYALTSRTPLTNVLLVADPQVLNEHSYPGRSKWLMTLTQYVVDFNLRKNWDAVIRKLDPHVVVFLGDMMDNGRASMGEDEYSQYYLKFKSIFWLKSSVPVYYLPGNHDVGLGSLLPHSSHAKDRYLRHFGPFNQRLEISNHTFVFIDAPGLVDEYYHRDVGDFQEEQAQKGGTIAFLEDFAEQHPSGPVVLFSHIPLSRPDHSPCGPLREKGSIRPGTGRGYQNLLPREMSSFILKSVRPAVIFSGDDHDHCEYVHTSEDGSKVREVTVKSFSMAMGIRRPGFQLLSLSAANTNPSSHSSITFADKACLLPNQIKIYTHGYAILATLSVACLVIFNYKHRRHYPVQPTSWTDVEARSNSPLRWNLRFFSNDGRTVPVRPRADEGSLDSYEMLSEATNLDALESRVENAHDVSSLGMWHSMDRRTTPAIAAKRTENRVRKALHRIFHTSWIFEGGPRSWCCNAARDLCQVAPPAMCLYLIISFYVFWR